MKEVIDNGDFYSERSQGPPLQGWFPPLPEWKLPSQTDYCGISLEADIFLKGTTSNMMEIYKGIFFMS